MKLLPTFIKQYTNGLITRDELEALIFKAATIAAAEICDPNNLEFMSVQKRIINDYNTYAEAKLGG